MVRCSNGDVLQETSSRKYMLNRRGYLLRLLLTQCRLSLSWKIRQGLLGPTASLLS